MARKILLFKVFNSENSWSKIMNRHIKSLIMIVFLGLLVYPLTAEVSPKINCGRILYTWSESGNEDIVWPADFTDRENVMKPRIYLATEGWTDTDGTFHSFYIDHNMYTVSQRRVVKYPYPVTIVDGQDISKPDDWDAIDPDMPVDQMVEIIMNSPMGVTITERVYGYSHPTYQDFVISHYQVVNTGEADEYEGVDLPGQTLNNFYFADARGYDPGNELPSDYCAGGYSYWGDYYGDEPGEELKLCYGWDGNDPKNTAQCGDDEGNPNPTTGAFTSPQYCGHGLIHVDRGPHDRTHDVNQPISLNRINNRTVDQLSDSDLFDAISDTNNAITPVDPTQDPSVVQSPILFMGYGPYTLEFGDTLNFVFFRGVSGISTEQCDSIGYSWKNGEITNTEKNTVLRTGLDSLKLTMTRAIDLWDNNLQIPGGANLVPPDTIKLQSGPGRVYIYWEAVENAQGYNVYRGIGKQDSVRFSLIVQGIDSLHYTDQDVKKGFDYYYNVTAVDANNIESSRYWLRTTRRSVVPTTALGRSSMADVRVVPNPFIWSEGGNYTGYPNKILFAGLPGPCEINIYTISGDLVKTIIHNEETGLQDWDQITKYNQYIASGTYVYHVRELYGKGDKTGIFIIIR